MRSFVRHDMVVYAMALAYRGLFALLPSALLLAALSLGLAGLGFCLSAAEGRRYRALGWVYVVLFALSVAMNSRFYFLAPAYPALFAAGGVVAPVTVLPALLVETLARIAGTAGGDAGIEVETREVAELPQTFADRFGWESMTETVARVHDGLPPEERSGACVLAGNYGEAGAVDLFGEEHGLPEAISGHNSYHLWGPGDCDGETIVSVGVPRERLEGVFDRTERAGTVRRRYCMPNEDNLPVYVSREPKLPFAEAWPRFELYG